MLPREVKVALFGETRIGKTCLVQAYGGATEMPKYKATEIDGFGAKVEFKGVEITLNIIDLSGLKELKPIRMMAAGDADCAILCFSLDDDKSFERALDYWRVEIESILPKCPILLCGTKSDLRDISMSKG